MLGCASGCVSVCTRPLFSISNQRAPPGWRESSGGVHKSGPAWKDLHRQAGTTVWIWLCQVCILWDRTCSSPLRSWDQTWLQWLFREGTIWCHWSFNLEPSRDELEATVTPFHSMCEFHLKTLGTNSDIPLTSLHLPLSLNVLIFFYALFSVEPLFCFRPSSPVGPCLSFSPTSGQAAGAGPVSALGVGVADWSRRVGESYPLQSPGHCKKRG